jgi:hypothetical protein
LPDAGIRIEGLPELQKIMDEVGSLRPVKKGLGKGAVHLKGKIARYPRQRPPKDPRRIYIRGVGTRYVPTGRTYLTSERHGQSWTVRSQAGGLMWIVGSDTTYGPFLQDEKKRTFYHQTTGWQTTEDVSKSEADDVNRFVKQEIDMALAKGK